MLAADLLQSIVNVVANRGLLHHPIGTSFGVDYPIVLVQYVDGTLLIMPTDACKLICLKGILRCFIDSTSLKVNFKKSFLVPRNIDDVKAQHLVDTLGCAVGLMPFTYFGLPLGTTRLTVQECMSLVCRVARKLTGIT